MDQSFETARALIARLGMKAHPEGGHYVETFRDRPDATGRPIATAILFLLQAGEVSDWHRVTDAAEIWHWHAGAPVVLTQSADGVNAAAQWLGPDVLAGQFPQIIVPANHWQTAASLGTWTLVGCTVTPGFVFSSFELAAPGWRPGKGSGSGHPVLRPVGTA
ncbi:MAG: cupin domain-containing protein [Rhizobiaceae bacterium]|nr:cupin domain-containing protein [Rhizobiaceae bacterium]